MVFPVLLETVHIAVLDGLALAKFEVIALATLSITTFLGLYVALSRILSFSIDHVDVFLAYRINLVEYFRIRNRLRFLSIISATYLSLVPRNG